MAWYNPTTWFGNSEKTADNIFDKDKGLLTQVGGWVGNMNFTEEERHELNMKIADKAAEFTGKTMEESTVRSKTRRRIATLWIELQVLLILLTAIAIPINKDLAKSYYDLATSDIMFWTTGSIVVFFFGGYVWGAHVKKKT